MSRPFTRGSLPVTVALTALIAAGAAPAGATSDSAPQFRALKPSASAAAAHTVRLITGDSVIVTGKGEQQHVMFQAGTGNPGGSAEIEQYGTNITVIPDEARPLLASGALDARLFDVDVLIAQGYADGADVPVIVQNKDASAPVPEGSKQVRKLPGIKAAAARVAAKNTRTFWSGLRSTRDGARCQGRGHSRQERAADRRPRGLGGGLRRQGGEGRHPRHRRRRHPPRPGRPYRRDQELLR
ncbi:hypothetical protein [Streptomyces sp. LN499]|uniref:hypothetical protein n=1 Tax=Streptomyces sp. LN499 TaxID=3112977 RepID=UPI003718D393